VRRLPLLLPLARRFGGYGQRRRHWRRGAQLGLFVTLTWGALWCVAILIGCGASGSFAGTVLARECGLRRTAEVTANLLWSEATLVLVFFLNFFVMAAECEVLGAAEGLLLHSDDATGGGTTAVGCGCFVTRRRRRVARPPVRYGDAAVLRAPRAHGTSQHTVQSPLRFGIDGADHIAVADRVCCFNANGVDAEPARFFAGTHLERELREAESAGALPLLFRDSVTGKAVFKAPVGRSVDAFLAESARHGWPSFRDPEVVWENVRVLRRSGECVSVDGTHLGANIPSGALCGRRNRFCINLVAVAGHLQV